MVQLIDIFAKPMICLLRELVQWFEDQGPNSIGNRSKIHLILM